jgi:phenylacetic acid degradation operon negative regulatory protein
MTDAARSEGHASRPLSARFLIATILLGADEPRVRAAQLVKAGSLFGIASGAMRTALWRMAADGELAADGGWYRLAGPLRHRRRRVDDSYAPARRPWDGTWELAIVSAERRSASERLALRTAAGVLNLAQVREGIWARPDNLHPDRLPTSRAVVDAQCVRFARATGPDDLAARLFDLDGWAARARGLQAALAAQSDTDPLAGGLVLSIDVVRHLQADPLLPDELLPEGWPGDALRRDYAEHERSYAHRLGTWLAADT